MSTASGRRRSRLWLPLLLAAAFFAAPARAQLMHLDPIPFQAAADSTSRLALSLDLDRYGDDHSGWSANRALLTAFLPAGASSIFFIRMPHVTFDTGETPLGSRWPWVLGPDGQDAWPGERRVSSFGKFEVGACGPLELPLLRRLDYGVAAGLPTGGDRIYPFSAQSIPVRLQVRRPVSLGTRQEAYFKAGYLMHMGTGREYLAAEAFPSGTSLGAELVGRGHHGRLWSVAWDYRREDGRRSQLVSLQVWLPWTAHGVFGVRFARELAGTLDRPAAWQATVSWRLDSARHKPGRGPVSAAAE